MIRFPSAYFVALPGLIQPAIEPNHNRSASRFSTFCFQGAPLLQDGVARPAEPAGVLLPRPERAPSPSPVHLRSRHAALPAAPGRKPHNSTIRSRSAPPLLRQTSRAARTRARATPAASLSVAPGPWLRHWCRGALPGRALPGRCLGWSAPAGPTSAGRRCSPPPAAPACSSLTTALATCAEDQLQPVADLRLQERHPGGGGQEG